MKPNPQVLNVESPSAATPAETLEHIQWLNSPLTRKLIKLIQRQRSVDARIIEHSVFDPTIANEQIRAHAARAWMCGKILELVDTLPSVDVPAE